MTTIAQADATTHRTRAVANGPLRLVISSPHKDNRSCYQVRYAVWLKDQLFGIKLAYVNGHHLTFSRRRDARDAMNRLAIAEGFFAEPGVWVFDAAQQVLTRRAS